VQAESNQDKVIKESDLVQHSQVDRGGSSLNISCDNCGLVSDFRVDGAARETLHIACNGCGSRVLLQGASIELDDGFYEVDATPPTYVASGSHPDDPWVWHKARMLESQRLVVQAAVRRILKHLNKPYGEATVGLALERICADFLAGPDPMGWSGDSGEY
jgi:DNA-directed RNA polymerase subunit RPC12/RpoP